MASRTFRGTVLLIVATLIEAARRAAIWLFLRVCEDVWEFAGYQEPTMSAKRGEMTIVT